MGIRGLFKYVEDHVEKSRIAVNIVKEINAWKREHETAPLIVIDLLSFISILSRNEKDLICGGRHHQYYDLYEKLFSDIKANGAELVFFTDVNLSEDKMNEWITRANNDYEKDIKLFEELVKYPLSYVAEKRQGDDRIYCSSVTDIVITTAEKYGAIYYSTKTECDRELALYARDNNAMAIFTDDSDFLIFEGDWRLFRSTNLNLDLLITWEYDRKVIFKHFGLKGNQFPLLATLMGNDTTKSIFKEELATFQKLLGAMPERAVNIRNFIRDLKCNTENLNRKDILTIARKVFTTHSDLTQKCALISESIAFYELDFVLTDIDDEFAKQLTKYRYLSLYEYYAGTIHTFKESFNDLRCSDIENPIINVISKLLLKFIGIFNWHKPEEEKPTVTKLGLKRTHDESFYWEETEIIYPQIDLPSLMDLIFAQNADQPLNETRWSLFFWILSTPVDKQDLIKSLPKDYMLIATNLFFMIQEKQVLQIEADGLLLAESKIIKNEIEPIEYPYKSNLRNIRTAHLYHKSFKWVNMAFNISGLNNFINDNLMFDGVLYQKIMENKENISTQLEDLQPYRIYSC